MAETFHLQAGGQHYQVTANSREEAIAKVQAHRGQTSQEPPAAAESAPAEEPSLLSRTFDALTGPRSVVPALRDAGRVIKPAADIGTTAALGAVGEAAGGIAGLIGLGVDAASDQSVQERFERGNSRATAYSEMMRNVFSRELTTEGGRKAVAAMAPHLEKLGFILDDAIVEGVGPIPGTGDNALAGAAIKTAILGMLEAVPVSRAGAARINFNRRVKDVEKVATDMGIRFNPKDFRDSVQRAFTNMSSTARGAGGSQMAQAVSFLRDQADSATRNFRDIAKRSRSFVEVDSMKSLAAKILHDLHMDFDIDKLPVVKKALTDMVEVDKQTIGLNKTLGARGDANVAAVPLGELNIVRSRLAKVAGGQTDQGLAATRMQNWIDEFMDTEFDKALIAAGDTDRVARGSGALSGDLRGLAAWQDADAALRDQLKRFDVDKQVAKIATEGWSPETLRQWVFGASKTNLKAGAGNTVKRLKEILGPDHPSINGLREDIMFELTESLMVGQTAPRFGNFVRDWDNFKRRNPTVFKELGFDGEQYRQLRAYAEAAERLGEKLPISILSNLPQKIAQVSFGHQIARKALQVRLARDIIAKGMKKDKVSLREMLRALSEANFNLPTMPSNSRFATEAILAAQPAAMQRLIEDEIVESEE